MADDTITLLGVTLSHSRDETKLEREKMLHWYATPYIGDVSLTALHKGERMSLWLRAWSGDSAVEVSFFDIVTASAEDRLRAAAERYGLQWAIEKMGGVM